MLPCKSPVSIIFLWHLIHSFLNSFHKQKVISSHLPSLLTVLLCSFVSVGKSWKTLARPPQALATAVQSTRSLRGLVGTELLPALLCALSFTPERELNSLRLNEIMIPLHTIFYV